MAVHFAPLGNPALHFDLTRLAATHCGVCLPTALGSGMLSAKGHADVITRCRACPLAQDCSEQLAEGSLPEGCPNRGVFERLAG